MADTRTARGVRPPPPRDGLTAPYVTLLAVGVVSFLIILLAFGQLVQGTVPWQHVSARARIQGVYRYDPATGRATSGPHTRFLKGQSFAARVDWSTLPSRLQVGARWYDDTGEDWGGIQPGTPQQLENGGFSLVPMVRTDAPPGTYTLDVMRYSAGRPVQVLGSTHVTVHL
ncbi:MAG: hypothetical protein J2P44_09670 [Candidatus Dormibacteraeota bacterium]|nr:hypothetical protein [Candidatus Dormibacteraeota bacterium]